ATPQPTPQQKAALAACRGQANQEFAIRNRSSLYQPNTSLSPYAAASPDLQRTRKLADQYSHHQMVQACLRGANGPAPVGATPSPTP
ncbi:MAG: hypothetical protein ACRESR_05190, partial [Gammaproteobacteria bacterium]